MEPHTRDKYHHEEPSFWVLAFPTEVIANIVLHLDPKSILQSAQICKQWNHFLQSQEDFIWRSKMIEYWPEMEQSIKIASKQYAGKKRFGSSLKQVFVSKFMWNLSNSSMRMTTTEEDWEIKGNSVCYSSFSDGSVVRTSKPWTPFTLLSGHKVSYFEVEVEDPGQDSGFGIGIGDHQTPFNTIPGWNRGEGYTCGYHADNGLKYFNMGNGKNFSEPYGKGDTIGCGFDHESLTIFFTRNGSFIGCAFKSQNRKFYPMMGTLEQCKMKFNLGLSPFVFNLDMFYLKELDKLKASVART